MEDPAFEGCRPWIKTQPYPSSPATNVLLPPSDHVIFPLPAVPTYPFFGFSLQMQWSLCLDLNLSWVGVQIKKCLTNKRPTLVNETFFFPLCEPYEQPHLLQASWTGLRNGRIKRCVVFSHIHTRRGAPSLLILFLSTQRRRRVGSRGEESPSLSGLSRHSAAFSSPLISFFRHWPLQTSSLLMSEEELSSFPVSLCLMSLWLEVQWLRARLGNGSRYIPVPASESGAKQNEKKLQAGACASAPSSSPAYHFASRPFMCMWQQSYRFPWRRYAYISRAAHFPRPIYLIKTGGPQRLPSLSLPHSSSRSASWLSPLPYFTRKEATQWHILYVSLVPFCNDGKSESEPLNLHAFFPFSLS